MDNICACCGEKIGFMDVSWDYFTVDNNEYKVCGKCRVKMANYKIGAISIKEVVSDKTNPAIEKYVRQNLQQIDQTILKKQRDERKVLAQKTDPLFDDIHQIAGDVRFIKNLMIFLLALSFILGLISVLSVLFM